MKSASMFGWSLSLSLTHQSPLVGATPTELPCAMCDASLATSRRSSFTRRTCRSGVLLNHEQRKGSDVFPRRVRSDWQFLPHPYRVGVCKGLIRYSKGVAEATKDREL